MDKLLALIAEIGANDEEDVVIRLLCATWSDASLKLRLAVSIDYSEQRIWEVRCEDVLTYNLDDQGAFSLELTDDHPLLWEHKQPSASAFFKGVPVNADASVGALYQAHEKAVGSWIRFGKHLNNSHGLSWLLSGGHGLLARGPVPLLNVYKETLHLHGVEVDIRFASPPQMWDGTHFRQLQDANAKVLLLSTSYVIGSGWGAQQIS
jgi:hypothetical protein